MEFTRDEIKIPLFLPQRSLLIIECEARYNWKHAIPARKSDDGTFPVKEEFQLLSGTFYN